MGNDAEKEFEKVFAPGKLLIVEDFFDRAMLKTVFVKGYNTGRSSRDRLRKELKRIAECCEEMVFPCDRVWKVLEEDEKHGE